MKELLKSDEGARGKLIIKGGNKRFLGRITAIGLTPGTHLEVVKNAPKKPLLVYARDTLIAINRSECEQLFLEDNHER